MDESNPMAAVLRRSHLTRVELKIAECLALLRAGHRTDEVDDTLRRMRDAKLLVEKDMRAAGQEP